MRKQIVGAALIGALAVGGGVLWQAPAFCATPDLEAAFSPDGGAERLVLRTIYGAQQSVRVMAYSFTAAPVVKALLDAKRRGVDVAVTVDYRSNVDEDRSGKAAAALRALVYAGIPVRVVRAYAMQHSKFIVTDRTTVQTGSYNFSQAAARVNSENVVVLSNQPEIAQAFLRNWSEVSAAGEVYRAP
ncbi:PLD-like domain protein [Paraburkholderia fungorum]|uniref:phospholipase D n=1 Tax=Paraburkholderia fungorum TaxID=134537 RepID=A0AAP5QF36_9BURK|nr:phospholipase D family protein [Paraburkholderia fungorum]AJZ56823.1 PLD-like domain protein [Paraburkholderia fungorum]MDT8842618.1 phospholipase D family protein [Paraburkholderia fungorum]PRZ49147.1 phospholipase D-like protein [Paraburkholderia fungorum]